MARWADERRFAGLRSPGVHRPPTGSRGQSGPQGLAAVLIGLQRAAGNRAVSGLLRGDPVAVQRTKWTYSNGQWTKHKNSDTDRYKKPQEIDLDWDDGDEFDQATGEITSSAGEVKTIQHLAGEKEGKDFGAWYGDKRQRTAYGFLSDEGKQGPHTFAHIGKRVMAESSMIANPDFKPHNIPERSMILPSAGQSRRLLKDYQENSRRTISKRRLKQHNIAYKKALKARRKGADDDRVEATVKAMELNPLATYGFGRLVTKQEIKGKGEKRGRLAEDVSDLSAWERPSSRPKLKHTDEEKFPKGKSGMQKNRFDKYMADIGTVAAGAEDLSEDSLSSEDEYSDIHSEDFTDYDEDSD